MQNRNENWFVIPPTEEIFQFILDNLEGVDIQDDLSIFKYLIFLTYKDVDLFIRVGYHILSETPLYITKHVMHDDVYIIFPKDFKCDFLDEIKLLAI